MRMGANLTVQSADITLFTAALTRDVRRFREAFQEEAAPGKRRKRYEVSHDQTVFTAVVFDDDVVCR